MCYNLGHVNESQPLARRTSSRPSHHGSEDAPGIQIIHSRNMNMSKVRIRPLDQRFFSVQNSRHEATNNTTQQYEKQDEQIGTEAKVKTNQKIEELDV